MRIAKLSRVPIKPEHPRSRPVGQWFLRDLLFGKVVVEVGDQHSRWIIGERVFEEASSGAAHTARNAAKYDRKSTNPIVGILKGAIP